LLVHRIGCSWIPLRWLFFSLLSVLENLFDLQHWFTEQGRCRLQRWSHYSCWSRNNRVDRMPARRWRKPCPFCSSSRDQLRDCTNSGNIPRQGSGSRLGNHYCCCTNTMSPLQAQPCSPARKRPSPFRQVRRRISSTPRGGWPIGRDSLLVHRICCSCFCIRLVCLLPRILRMTRISHCRSVKSKLDSRHRNNSSRNTLRAVIQTD